MDKSQKDMDKQEQKIQKLADDINPSQDVIPDSLAEATTVPLDDDALGGNATEDDVKKNKHK
ncbi:MULTISPECIES: hypothetical protein [unclassified Psychrobacter]|uniref:hypothetical protein n=1 Tax=unclassified Psychrobacter TaxID=196806 RepID=UPI0009A7246C|nr:MULTISPECIES: hypothetical protein [unclassified Psychrobacter]MDE4454282.1 hypothetical protein [Psychrobacter sp. DAB_AL62B]OXL19212.1 hypothetical protein CAN34_11380 [Psychrobacter sp. DAB_AL32B]SLJ83311.1 hypothetical protein DABAL43B_0089 [Psychrobacter sp. DAB_AL43B]